MPLRHLILLSLLAATVGCKRETAATTRPATAPAEAETAAAPATAPVAAVATTARFATASVSTSKGHGFFLTGTMAEGRLRKGERVIVHTSNGLVEQRIERIESTDGNYADLPLASK